MAAGYIKARASLPSPGRRPSSAVMPSARYSDAFKEQTLLVVYLIVTDQLPRRARRFEEVVTEQIVQPITKYTLLRAGRT